MLNKKGKIVNGTYLGQIYWIDETAGKNSGRPQDGRVIITSDDEVELNSSMDIEVERLQVKNISVKDVSFYSKI